MSKSNLYRIEYIEFEQGIGKKFSCLVQASSEEEAKQKFQSSPIHKDDTIEAISRVHKGLTLRGYV